MSYLRSLIRSADKVTEFESYFEKLPIDRHTTHSLETQRKEINGIWRDFKACYEDTLDRIDDTKEKSDIQSVKACYFATYESYLRMSTRVNELLDTLGKTSKRKSDNEELQEQTSHIAVPPCDIEIFHGDYKSWPTFRDMFTALYRDNKRLSAVEKLCHLLQKTEGTALDLLQTCPITNEGFEMAWGKLVNRYEGNRSLSNYRSSKCFLCSLTHPLRLCPTFSQMPTDERYAIVKRQKRCINCLDTTHDFKICKSRFICNYCQQSHHSLLHRRASPSLSTSSYQQHSTSPTPSTVVIPHNEEKTSRLYNPPKIYNITPLTINDTTYKSLQTLSAQIQPNTQSPIPENALVDVYKDDVKNTVPAQIDSASKSNITGIAKNLHVKLNLQNHSFQTEVHGSSDSLTNNTNLTSIQTCRLQIASPLDNQVRLHTDDSVSEQLMGHYPLPSPRDNPYAHLPMAIKDHNANSNTGQLSNYHSSSLRDNPNAHLPMADKKSNVNLKIQLRIERDVYPKIIHDGFKWDQNQLLAAQKWMDIKQTEAENKSSTNHSSSNNIIRQTTNVI